MTAATDALEWQDEPGLRTATTAGAELLRHVRVWRPAERGEIVTADHETAAVLLAGTFDLLAGPPAGDRTSWPARGARETPFAGRPMAVFLPPENAFEARNGTADGEILLFGATQQRTDEAPKEGRAALSQSPLLPLAGSGKSFDPNSGEWMPAETFPTSAESLPPRRMRRRPVGEVEVERVFTSDYKAATLTVDEAVLQVGAPEAVAEAVASYRGETRSGRLLTIDPALLTAEPATDEELQSHLDANADQYTAPEYRAVDLIILDPAIIAADIELSDEQIEDYYRSQESFYTTPATRLVTQLLAMNAPPWTRRLSDLRRESNLRLWSRRWPTMACPSKELGPFEPGGLPEPIDGAMWQANDTDFGEPVESAFGWHSFRLIDETPEEIASIDEKRDEIVEALTLQEANILLPDLARALDDEIGAGEPLTVAADRLQLPLYSIDSVDPSGLDKDGEFVVEPELAPDMLSTIFASEVDRISLLETADDDRQYVFNIRAITEPRPRTLDEVRDQIIAAIENERREEQAVALAEELLADAKAAGTIDGMDEATELSIVTFGPLNRSDIGRGVGFDRESVDLIFNGSLDEIADGVVTVASGPAIAIIEDIVEAPADAGGSVGLELSQSLQADILNHYASALEARYPASINQELLAQMMAPPESQQGQF